jgi:hypothetical protein
VPAPVLLSSAVWSVGPSTDARLTTNRSLPASFLPTKPVFIMRQSIRTLFRMKLFSKERAFLTVLVLTMAAVLVTLGVLQYRWSQQVSEADDARLGNNLRSLVMDWHLDFFREFSGIAVRDGLYAGKMDAAQGNRPHLSSGRWSADVDRRSYVVGYQKGYSQVLQFGLTAVPAPQLAELNGYRDGVNDGASDRRAAKPFQLSKTDNYKNAAEDLVEVGTDQERSRLAYPQAYANGYQEAYYGRDRQNRDSSSELSSSL